MASVKELKKDINYLTYEVISDCYIFIHLFPGKKTEEVSRIISDTIDAQNDLLHRVNHPQGSEKKQVKDHFKNIAKDLVDTVDKAFESLSALTKK